jgi:hypothetical protein
MAKDVLDFDALVLGLKNLGNKILGFVTDTIKFRNYIRAIILFIEYFMFLTDCRIYLSFSPSKGGAAVIRMYRMTPSDQISQRSS